jgi:hypothetical protein
MKGMQVVTVNESKLYLVSPIAGYTPQKTEREEFA